MRGPVTSYNPFAKGCNEGRDWSPNTETDKQFIFNAYTDLLKDVVAKRDMTKTETYEEEAKSLFKKEPANMKLLGGGRQTAHGFRRTALHVSLHRQVDAGSRFVSGYLPR